MNKLFSKISTDYYYITWHAIAQVDLLILPLINNIDPIVAMIQIYTVFTENEVNSHNKSTMLN